MATGILRITTLITGLPEGETPVGPLELQIASAVGERKSPVSLAAAANTFAVPVGATVLIFIPAAGNTQALTLKGVTGDTGIRLHKTFPGVFPLDAAANGSIVILNGGPSTITGCSLIFI